MEDSQQEILVPDLKKFYPTHGVIGSTPPGWLDLGTLHRSPSSSSKSVVKSDPRRRKLDLEDALNQCNSTFCKQHGDNKEAKFSEPPIPDWSDRKRTLQAYPENETPGSKLPDRFDNPYWFKGYGCEKRQHPFYATTSSQYGKFPPNVHTMPVKYCPMKNAFSEHLTSTVDGRNRSLNIK